MIRAALTPQEADFHRDALDRVYLAATADCPIRHGGGVPLCPATIGNIVNSALVLVRFEHKTIS